MTVLIRTFDEIKDEIIEARKEKFDIRGIVPKSIISVQNLWTSIVAQVIQSFETVNLLTFEEIDDALSTRINGTPQWYVDQAKLYQHGDELQVLNGGLNIGYPIIDEGKKIITRASYAEEALGVDKKIVIKVAKGDVGALAPLSIEEYIGLEKYFQKIKFAGTNVDILSNKGDILIPRFKVYHNGFLESADMLTNIKDAIKEFMQELPFDGILFRSALVDKIIALDYVTDVHFDGVTDGLFLVRYDTSGNLVPGEVEVVRKETIESGYLQESQEVTVDNFDDALQLIVES